jgi:NitT/TauT family transport system ATP-binding protein
MSQGYAVAAQGLSHSYDGKRFVLRDISLTVSSAEVLCVLGANGSGKSTLLMLAAGLMAPSAGTVTLTPAPQQPKTSPRIALLHQDYRQSNWPWASALENVTFPLRFAGITDDERRARGSAVLETLLPEVRPTTRAWELSGGQQQLLSIARAIVARPDVLLADEPLSATDQPRVMRAISALQSDRAIRSFPCLWVSHSLDEALLVGDRFVVLQPTGACVAFGLNPILKQRTAADLTTPSMVALRARLLNALLSHEPDEGRSNGIGAKAKD